MGIGIREEKGLGKGYGFVLPRKNKV